MFTIYLLTNVDKCVILTPEQGGDNKLKKIIMLSGKAESGKNYIADMIYLLLSKKGYKSQFIAFADYLKFICKQYLGWNGNKDEDGRTYLQYVGTGVCRQYDDKFFSSKVIEFIKLFGNRWDFIIVTDLRFVSELLDVKSSFDNVITVRVNRPGHESKLTEEQRNNESETELDEYSFDKEIVNDASVVDEVRKFVEELVNGLYKKDSQC